MRKKKKTPLKLFIAVFAILIVFSVLQNLTRQKTIALEVPNNAGVAALETIDSSLVCVFADGRAGVWDWNALPSQKGDFKAVSDRVIVLDSEHLAAVNKEGKKLLTLYELPSGKKQKELSVGWEDQEVWPRISFDKRLIGLIRKNPADTAGKIVYEFLTLDREKELTGVPVSLGIREKQEDFVDYAVGGNRVLYAVGSKEKIGRIAAIDLEKGRIVWDQVYSETLEFCSAMVTPNSDYLLAGSRDGLLYKLNAKTGAIEKKVHLLKEGEKRPITNDYSVLNLAFSPDGRYYVATINPPAYILDAQTDGVIHTFSPANKLVSKIAFSPDNQFVATSDIRAGYPVKVLPLPEQ